MHSCLACLHQRRCREVVLDLGDFVLPECNQPERNHGPHGRPPSKHRASIMDYLHRHGAATRVEIAQALGVSDRTVYDVLRTLMAEEQVQASMQNSNRMMYRAVEAIPLKKKAQ